LSGRILQVELGSEHAPFLLDEEGIAFVHGILDQALREGVQAVLFHSRHPRIFLAGADLRRLADMTPLGAWDFSRAGQDLFRRFLREPILVANAVDGAVRGGGVDWTAAADFTVASPRSDFAHPGLHFGIFTGWGGTQLLASAAEILLTGRVVGAKEARNLGWVAQVADDPLSSARRSLDLLLEDHGARAWKWRRRSAMLHALLPGHP